MLATRDHVAFCKICKASFCGKNSCRRCKCGSTFIPSSNHCDYYYGGYRKWTKYPLLKRNIDDELITLSTIEGKERKTVAKEMAKKAGFTAIKGRRLHVMFHFTFS